MLCVVCCRSLKFGCWLLFIDRWLLVVGRWSVVGGWWLVGAVDDVSVGCWSLVCGH